MAFFRGRDMIYCCYIDYLRDSNVSCVLFEGQLSIVILDMIKVNLHTKLKGQAKVKLRSMLKISKFAPKMKLILLIFTKCHSKFRIYISYRN